MMDDQTALQQYAAQGSREALDALIRRHLDLVYSAALRQVRDPHLAEDVTQAVFLILAKKAGTIRHGVAVGGWLLAVTRRASVDAMRRRAIDRRHEQAMARPESVQTPEPQWEQIAPELDEAMLRLPDADRDAVVLRFFQNYSLAQVGMELGISEEAARKRVGRALQRLRNLLTGSAATVGAATLGTVITSHAVQAAPAQLLPATLAGGASTSVSAIVKGAMNMMAWAKAKFAAAVILAVFIVLGGGTFLMTRSSAQSQPPGYTVPAPAQVSITPAEHVTLVQANNRFALDLFRQVNPKPDENAFFSPYSISTAIGMTWAGARGQTAAEIAKALHFSELPASDVTAGFNALQKDLAQVQARTGAQLAIANSLWPEQRPEAPFRPEYMDHIQADFGASLFPTDFKRNSEEARLQINHWVEDKTQDKIKDLLQQGNIDGSTRLVLVNAIYFKAKWATEFNPGGSTDAQFHLANGSSKPVVMMRNMFNTGYAEVTVDSKPVQILKLNYKNAGGGRPGSDGLSLLVILPQAADGLAAVTKSLTADTLSTWVDKLADTRTQIWLPKFTFKERYSLIDAMQQMGIKSAFIDPFIDSSDGADFSAMNGVRNLFISLAVHQTFINVDEEGTEAAAATAIAMAAGAAPRPPDVTFRADHPFLFLIRDDTSGSILFLGQLTNPPAPGQTAAEVRTAINAQLPGVVTSPLRGSPVFAANRGNTTSIRLTGAREKLGQAIAYLKNAPDAMHDGHTNKALASANEALAEIGKAEDYVKEHPESDTLQVGANTGGPPTDAVTVPTMNPRLPPTFGPQSTIMAGVRGGPTTRLGPPDANGMMVGADGKVISVNLYMAINYLNVAHQTLSNPGVGRSNYRGPLIGDIGGHNDAIKAAIKTAAEEAVAGFDYVHDHTDPSTLKQPAGAR